MSEASTKFSLLSKHNPSRTRSGEYKNPYERRGDILVRLSCGHGESNLHWYPVLETLHNLVQNINRKRATGRPVTGKIEGTLYESRDYR